MWKCTSTSTLLLGLDLALIQPHYVTFSSTRTRRTAFRETVITFEDAPAIWKSFGAGLLNDGSLNSRRRHAIIRKALRGELKDAYAGWLKLGDYWTQEEVFVGFVLACEAIVHQRSSAPVPVLPKRVWDEVEYRTWLRHYDDDEFWFHICDRLMTPETSPCLKQRNEFIKLLGAGKGKEAEALYYALGWDQNEFAESDLALIHMCDYVLGVPRP